MLDSLDTLIAFILIMLVVSLLITIAVQMAASLLNLRGLNLAYGLKRTFTVIVPDSDENAKKLVDFILKGQFLSDSFLPDWRVLKPWRHATAIRPEEVFDAIQRIAIGKESVDTTLVNTAKNLLIALGVDKQSLEDATNDITNGRAAKTLVTAYAAARQKLNAAKESIDKACQKLQDWTCIAQERAQQWLTMHTRIITVIFAFFFAFWLQIDTVEIFKLVSSNKAVRDKLIAQAGTVEAQAARVLVDSNVLRDALKSWSEQETDPTIKQALSSIDVATTDTREAVQEKVTNALDGKKPIKNFNAMVTAAAKKQAEGLSAELGVIKTDLDKTGFQLFPDGDGGRWGKGVGSHWWSGSQGHRWGILFSVALLSLGAPFWYHTPKDLMSLRSKVAENISDEQKKQTQKP
ncbi:MAG TPA: hypothetical protein VGA01_02350 [Candidatus Binatia bacterium]